MHHLFKSTQDCSRERTEVLRYELGWAKLIVVMEIVRSYSSWFLKGRTNGTRRPKSWGSYGGRNETKAAAGKMGRIL